LAAIDAVIEMSIQSATDTGRSLLGEALHWALPRLVIYVLAALGAVAAFTIWAVVYTYVWPGKPPTWIDAPAPTIDVPAAPALPAPAPSDVSPAIAHVPPDALPVEQLRKLNVYDLSNAKIGRMEDVLFSHDGKVVAYIVGVDGGFLGGQGKDIAVPFEAVQFKKKDDNTWMPVLNMSKDAVQNAPKQTFDPAAMKWKFVPVPAR
jgi:sporulation protein YlmC with PRC-barrel domain